MRLNRAFLLAVACVLSATALFAHDFWIEASKWRPKVGDRVAIDLKVGQHVAGDSVERNGQKIVSFVVRGPDGKDENVVGVDGRAPAGYVRTTTAGLYLVGYRSHTTPIELEAGKFEAYLAEEGLQPVIDARKASGSTQKMGREIYSRSVKSLILCGDAPKAGDAALKGFDARIGLRLEVVAEADPYTLKVGDELPVQIWFDDKPLEGALVGFTAQSKTEDDVRLRTDKEGRVRFKVAHTGMTLVRVVWMIPAAKDSGADWESTWGSLTFEIPEPTTPAPAK